MKNGDFFEAVSNPVACVVRRSEPVRFLGLDVGEKRIGVAISDPTNTFAQPLMSITRGAGDIDRIKGLIDERGVGEVVVGIPINMNGSRGESAKSVSDFAERLRAEISVPVVFVDERLSTQEAERMLISADLSRKKRKGVIDQVAAALILETRLRSLPSE
jgi:putative Holliday junction resolvase